MNENTQNENEIEIDLVQVAYTIWQNIIMIVLVTVVCALLGFIGSKVLIKKQYQSTTSLYVLNRTSQTAMTSSDLQSSSLLTKDFKILITSRSVTETVVSDLKLDIKPEALTKMIDVEIPTDTRVLNINVTSEDPLLSKKIADKVAEISSKQITNIMQVENVSVIEEGNVPTNAVKPNLKKNSAIAGLAGLFLSIVFVVIRLIMNDTIHTAEDVERYLGLSTLSLIPKSEAIDDASDNVKKKKHHGHKGKGGKR